jgi:hypothetical protein
VSTRRNAVRGGGVGAAFVRLGGSRFERAVSEWSKAGVPNRFVKTCPPRSADPSGVYGLTPTGARRRRAPTGRSAVSRLVVVENRRFKPVWLEMSALLRRPVRSVRAEANGVARAAERSFLCGSPPVRALVRAAATAFSRPRAVNEHDGTGEIDVRARPAGVSPYNPDGRGGGAAAELASARTTRTAAGGSRPRVGVSPYNPDGRGGSRRRVGVSPYNPDGRGGVLPAGVSPYIPDGRGNGVPEISHYGRSRLLVGRR